MLDGIFKKTGPGQPGQPGQPAAQPAAKVPAGAPKSAPASPLEVAKDASVGADFQSVVDEAAIVYASDEANAANQAATMLYDFLKKTQGHAHQHVWFMLLDIYQAQGQQELYERLSLMFAKKFGTSPPSWEEALGIDATAAGSGASGAGAAAAAAPGSAGRNVMIVEGGATEALGAKTKDFVAAARELKSCKIDVSRMKMEQCTPEGFSALQNIMLQLRKHKVGATLMGENHVAAWLEKRVKKSKDASPPDIADSPYWMLLLEILQWRGLMDQFEELSLDYTITYEVSGPGWEPAGVMTIEAVAEVEESASEAASANTGVVVPDAVITDVSVQRLHEEIKQAIAASGQARLEFRMVRRMDFSAAGTFLHMLQTLGPDKEKVSIENPSALILALGDIMGFSKEVRVVKRKR